MIILELRDLFIKTMKKCVRLKKDDDCTLFYNYLQMTGKEYSAAVVGLGAMGSAALYHLSRLGVSAVGLDQYSPPHTLGSTHGDTRITRLAIGEGSKYVPLVKRSHELWKDLESEAKEKIFVQSGGIVMASGDNPFLKQTISSAEEYLIDHHVLDASEIRKNYPVFNVSDETVACLEPSAGYVFPEKAVAAHLSCSKDLGADLMLDTRVENISLDKKEITTDKGVIRADKIIIAAGAWTSRLLPDLAPLLKVYRQVLYWFSIEKNYHQFVDMPIFIWEFGKTPDDFIYGFPAINGPSGGVKVATEEYEKEVSPNIGKAPASQKETSSIHSNYIEDNIPSLSQNIVRSASCLYTNTKDGQFLIDKISDDIWFISACSGHGFKHSPAIGEAVAEQVSQMSSKISLKAFQV